MRTLLGLTLAAALASGPLVNREVDRERLTAIVDHLR